MIRFLRRLQTCPPYSPPADQNSAHSEKISDKSLLLKILQGSPLDSRFCGRSLVFSRIYEDLGEGGRSVAGGQPPAANRRWPMVSWDATFATLSYDASTWPPPRSGGYGASQGREPRVAFKTCSKPRSGGSLPRRRPRLTTTNRTCVEVHGNRLHGNEPQILRLRVRKSRGHSAQDDNSILLDFSGEKRLAKSEQRTANSEAPHAR